MFNVLLMEDPLVFYQRADRILSKKLNRCLDVLKCDPRSGNNNIKMLTGDYAGLYRYRVGDWRLIYRIDDAKQEVIVSAIAHRSEAYE